MARRKRFHYPGAIYHVMLRGNNGKTVFTSDEERRRFCLLMQEGVERYGHCILAFCLMTNHIHLAVQVNKVPLSKIFQNLAFRYTRLFNWRHKVIGHLFQGRFKSVLVDSRCYLKRLLRYIHLNPVNANMVDDPLNYHWSSHRAYMMQGGFTWLTKDKGLMEFGECRSEAMQNFHKFVMGGIGLGEDKVFETGFTDGILGDDEFVESIKERFDVEEFVFTDMGTLLNIVCDWYDVDVSELKKPGLSHRNSHIRSMAAIMARDFEGTTLRELADFCGREASGMSKAAARLESRIKKSESIKEEAENLRKSIVKKLAE